MHAWLGVFWLVLLLIGNAFFVGAEFAVMSARRSQIEPLAEKGHKRAKTTLWAIENVSLMLATAQLGITVCSLFILNVSEPAIHHLLAEPMIYLGMGAELADGVAFVIAFALVTLLHVILGEVVPKNISVSFADRVAMLLAPPLVLISKLVKPIIVALNWAGNAFLKMIGIEPKDEVNSAYTLEEMQSIVEQSKKQGTVEDSDGLLTGALGFSSLKTREIMVPIAKVKTLPITVTPLQFEKEVADTGYSRFPLGNNKGVLIGYLHLKDVLGKEEKDKYQVPVPAKKIRPFINVAEQMGIEDALNLMQRNGTHLAQVIGAKGTVIGILFLEDILEKLIGKVKDVTQREVIA
ncbi:MAG: hemolysin family protein [Micrococcaceae bacterium]